MTKIAYSESESGNVVRTAVVPANRSEEPRFGPLDSTVIVVILLCFLAVRRGADLLSADPLTGAGLPAGRLRNGLMA